MSGLEHAKTNQQSKADRKLYVGNLPSGVSQSQLVELLNTELLKMRISKAGSAVSASISSDGHYAFVEFETIEEANKAFALNNRTILGNAIKVSRPKTYQGSQPASM